MGALSRIAAALTVVVLLVLTAPSVSASRASQAKSQIDQGVQELQTSLGDAQGDAQDGADDARVTAQEQGDGAQRDGEGRLTEARIRAEDTILAAWAVMVDAFTFTYDSINGFLTGLAPTKSSTVSGSNAAGLRSQSTSTIASDEAEAGSMLLMAASGGAVFLLVTLVRRLAALGLVPLLSRISHDEIYDNDARRNINELVLAEPGLCLNDIVARLGFSRNAVSYHLFVLEKEEAIVSIKDGKYRRYFTRNGKYVNGAKNVVAALRNTTTLAMARAVIQRPGAIQRDLCVELGATPSAACWHAKRLLDLGVIRKERYANTVRYFPGESLAKYDLSDFGLAPAPAPTA